MVNESLVRKCLKTAPDITLTDMLREFRRSSYPFRTEKNEEWDRLAQDLQDALDDEYHGGVFLKSSDPHIVDPSLSRDTIIPAPIKRKYLRCNVYCAEYLQARAKNFT